MGDETMVQKRRDAMDGALMASDRLARPVRVALV